MLFKKSCPKCKGDITIEQDEHGTYLSCITCGYTREFKHFGAKERPPKSDRADT